MSDCGVCIGGGGDGEYSEFHHTERPKARKSHICCECKREIFKGEFYEKVFGKFDGEVYREKTCSMCSEIREGFSCESCPPYGELWTEMKEYVFPDMSSSCFEKLSTPEAKTFLRLMWMEWKGLAA